MVGEVSALSEISEASLVCVASGRLFMECSLEAVEIKMFSWKLSLGDHQRYFQLHHHFFQDGGIMTDVF